MSQRRSYIAGAQVGAAIYAAGGMVGETGRPLATFSRYDAAARRLDAACRSCRWRRERRPRPRSAARSTSPAARRPTANTAASGRGTGTALARRARRCRARSSTTRPSRSAARLYAVGGYATGRELREVYATTRRPTAGRSPRVCRGRPRLRRGRVPRRALDDRRPARRGDPARGLDLVAADEPLASRPDDAEADGAARRGGRRRRDPRRLGVDVPGLRRGDRTLAAAAGARSSPATRSKRSRSAASSTPSAAVRPPCRTARSWSGSCSTANSKRPSASCAGGGRAGLDDPHAVV